MKALALAVALLAAAPASAGQLSDSSLVHLYRLFAEVVAVRSQCDIGLGREETDALAERILMWRFPIDPARRAVEAQSMGQLAGFAFKHAEMSPCDINFMVAAYEIYEVSRGHIEEAIKEPRR
ncbi:hypothetical protein D1114_07060 [Cereibacter sphaeroides]|uniref:Uncharacterized protein n=1 Tax=Cereibacter sphaeroides TaxID=1063 RepID=A0AAX1UMT6_CERSP|nr:hypothetical protein [Cereibacter sphaeroides]RHZ96463.1 hypothetical protein D1114_07060 [Cereibacter sphaeroides]